MDRLLTTLEKAVRVSAVLAALGYVSLRAHLNHLGVPAPWPLPVDRYLMEMYILTVGTLTRLLPLAAIGAALVLAYGLVKKALRSPRRQESLRRRAESTRQALGSSLAAWLVMLLTTVAALVLLGATVRYFDVAVGPIKAEKLPSGRDWPFEAGLTLLVAAWAVSYLASPQTPDDGKPSRGARAWRVCRATLAALAVLILPLLYGRAAHPTEFAVCRAHTKEGTEDVCGLLVLGTDTRMSLWRAERGIGEVVVVPAADVVRFQCIGTKDLLEEAQKAASRKEQAFPSCAR